MNPKLRPDSLASAVGSGTETEHVPVPGFLNAIPIDSQVRAYAPAASLDDFLRDVQRRAFRLAEIQLGHPDDAVDAVQDAMLRLVSHYRDKPADEWAPLFWGILRRRIIDLQRRRKVRSIIVGWLGGSRDQDGDSLPAWEPTDLAPGPAKQCEDRQAYLALSQAVRQLPRRQREAFLLRMMEGLDVADTARAMACSEGSVKTHLSRALSRLREQLEAWR